VRVVVCDVGLGNLRSVERALQEAARSLGAAGGSVVVSSDPGVVGAADRLVLPGQAAFGDYARALASGLGDAVRGHLRAERPYLGICMGLQVLFDESEEAPGVAGLGVFQGKVARFREAVDPETGMPLKVPHIGWNTAESVNDEPGLLAPGGAEHFYFVHSYVVVPTDGAVIAATTSYGERFVSAVARENLFACQFHPEKSQRAGIALLERFLAS
jgi:glutamine amidotransferase